ncbi:MAG: NADH-quinone oxidoreductase subunit J [Bacteroidetes bacterium CG02_land_8_20_14_3_00_31_25]|nr:NADH-quinone oxidoreductase subunit J [Bacteroidota bacterium]PIV58520.1 MAG: NADH-quinone oxidoreductase subunit J [Bacteroidetes bacterium CG02_land_8_20_14_3_00_31_25]PIX32594.1 MAG: NADH-quinone oxidoreductase subunit J [Bacteroidetes bacterium CG_4_8_14_3_um_filter_31_14]PIY02054.1 MAG: NADH-quinone oxidoreductase subunit J [Bacteroidetes bacterium CG_4_10_14_3_um_filter_31_20]
MELNQVMFFLLSGLILIFSVLSITSRRILRAAVYLLTVLLSTSGLYFLLNYEFMAAVQLTLYAGGIVVLIIFSILLTSHISHKFEQPAIANVLVGGITGLVGCGVAIWSILEFPFTPTTQPAIDVNMQQIGMHLMNTGHLGYALPFEVISVLLLAAMISAIIIAKKGN